MKEIRLDGIKGRLTRERDGAGDAGYFYAFDIEESEDGVREINQENGKIVVGKHVFCGAIFASMFGADTYWMTTKVSEILEVNEDKTFCRFKTGNSIYSLKVF